MQAIDFLNTQDLDVTLTPAHRISADLAGIICTHGCYCPQVAVVIDRHGSTHYLIEPGAPDHAYIAIADHLLWDRDANLINGDAPTRALAWEPLTGKEPFEVRLDITLSDDTMLHGTDLVNTLANHLGHVPRITFAPWKSATNDVGPGELIWETTPGDCIATVKHLRPDSNQPTPPYITGLKVNGRQLTEGDVLYLASGLSNLGHGRHDEHLYMIARIHDEGRWTDAAHWYRQAGALKHISNDWITVTLTDGTILTGHSLPGILNKHFSEQTEQECKTLIDFQADNPPTQHGPHAPLRTTIATLELATETDYRSSAESSIASIVVGGVELTNGDVRYLQHAAIPRQPMGLVGYDHYLQHIVHIRDYGWRDAEAWYDVRGEASLPLDQLVWERNNPGLSWEPQPTRHSRLQALTASTPEMGISPTTVAQHRPGPTL